MGGRRLVQIQKMGVKLQTLKSGGKTTIRFESGGMDAIVPVELGFVLVCILSYYKVAY